MRKAKFEKITLRAIQQVIDGATPENAWLETLREFYPVEKQFENQVKHTCPKWAFCILCHKGYIKGVRPNCCPKAEISSSAAYTLKALGLLRSDPSLAANKKELKRKVFGECGTFEYRTPNDEVEVLLALWNSGVLQDSISQQSA